MGRFGVPRRTDAAGPGRAVLAPGRGGPAARSVGRLHHQRRVGPVGGVREGRARRPAGRAEEPVPVPLRAAPRCPDRAHPARHHGRCPGPGRAAQGYRGSMSVYVLVQLTVHDRDRYNVYANALVATMTPHGGKVLVADDAPRVLEGQWTGNRVVMLEFPDRDAFRTWAGS